jgi:hypothetical protein
VTPSYFAAVRPTYIENWPVALARLSIPQTDVPLSLEEARALAALNGARAGLLSGPDSPHIDAVAGRIGAALRAYADGAFIRLGSRSGKDSRYARQHGLRVFRPEAAIRMLTEGSRRIAFDLRLALRYDYRPHIFVRQWCEIPCWAEFRCFVRDRRLVGVSQYDCKNLGPRREIAENAARIEDALTAFFATFDDASHLDNVVADVFVNIDDQDRDKTPAVKLLELNPFIPETDPCLFTWRSGTDFDGTFRFLYSDVHADATL